MISRRGFIKTTAATAISAPLMAKAAKPISQNSADGGASDEAYWQDVASHFPTTDGVINLENGYWGIMAKPVLDDYQKWTEQINFHNTHYARNKFYDDMQGVMQKVAAFMGVDVDEIAYTRGATEALQNLIAGYNQLQPGDAVLYADLDYGEMKINMRWLEQYRGVEVIKINIPEPATKDNVLAVYQKAFEQHPNIKMALLTHVNNHTGLLMPIKEINQLAKQHGIETILDAAHSIGQVDFDVRDLGSDYIGFNFHKWIGAPVGCGIMYIKKDKISHIDTYMGEPDHGRIQNRVVTGTTNFAAVLTMPKAIDFHQGITSARKQKRLKYLRDLWVNEVRDLEQIQVLTPNDDDMVAALTSFRIRGAVTTEENNALVKRLLNDYGILSVRRTAPALGDCVRITPSLYNGPDDVYALAKALRDIVI